MLEADPHVIRTAAAGDHRAFETLVRTYQEPVVRFLAHLLGDRALADDVAQETFLRCYQKLNGYSFEGRDAIVDFLRRSMGAETFHSSHKMHHPEIDLTGPDSAKGVWALDDVVVDTQWNITIRGASFYDDEYVKRDGKWLIKRTSYRRVYEELQPRGNVEGLSLTASWWATDGKSKLPAG